MGSRPAGITIIALLLAVQGVAAIILGLEGAGITSFGLGAASGGQFAGYSDIVVGIITLVVSYGLFSLQGWAWLLAVIVTVVRIATGIWAVALHGISSALGISAIVAIVIGLFFLWYFMRPSVRSAFGR
jgi:hypothetical protein